MSRNIVYKYREVDSGLDKLTNVTPIKENNQTDIAYLYAPFGTDTVMIKLLPNKFFEVNKVNPIPAFKCETIIDQEVIDAIVPEGDTETGWFLWFFPIGVGVSGILKSNRATQYQVSFQRLDVDISDENFIGNHATASTVDATISAELDVKFPDAVEGNYVNVYKTTSNEYTSWLLVGITWVDQEVLTNETLIANTLTYNETFKSTTLSNDDFNVGTPEEQALVFNQIYSEIAELEGKILSIELLLGTDGVNFVKSDLAASYTAASTPEGNDQMYMQKANGDKRRVSFADLSAAARDNFIGTFDTASGLTCPDPDDLLCVYPNGIADPNDRLGWVANVTATNSKWRWITASNDWQDTGEAPSLAKDIGYDPVSDPSTNETNVQDAMVEHGVKIKANEDDIVVVQNKTQNFNAFGGIGSSLAISTGADLASVDLDTGTGGTYLAIIQALIGEYLRNNAQDGLISTNSSDILARLVKDFSTLINKSTPEDGDLMALWDVTSSTNKNISWAEFKAAIDTSLINDQGWYANLAALQSAIPVGEDGWHATIGDVDTRAVWDSDTGDWIEVASKLYYTVTEGGALEVRVGNNETAITAINVTLGNKEDLANKVDTIIGNEASTIKYLSAKGVFDYVNPQVLISQEVRRYSKAVQVGLVISRASTDTTLSDGRIDRVEIEGGIIQNPGLAQYSIDGGTTLKNIAVYDVGSSSYVNLDLSISIVSGSYFTLLYSLTLDKWLAVDSDVDVSMIRGSGWLPVMTTSGNYALIGMLTLRVDNLEENQGVPALQEVAIDTPIIVTTNGIAHELVFDEATIPSNETDILDVDGNFNHVIKVNTEPGLDFKIYVQIKNQGTPGSTADSTFYIANKSAPVTAGDFIIGKKYRINSVGTTDFTLIGASGNTIGIIFTATGVGTGTGSALIVFRDVRITAIGQDIENNRAIPFSISNDDYVAPFTPGVYYTNDGVDFNVLQTILTCTTIFPSGNAPASSETTILIDSATETRNGLGTKQKEHNDESVVDRKNLLEAGNVVVATYQSAGQYMANKTDIILDTNKIVRVLFSGFGADLTELVELSLDNGSIYYDVEYRETDVDLTVKNAVTHVMDLYFTGTKFIATYVDSVIENQGLPYVKLQGRFDIPKNDVPVHICEEIAEVVQDYKGGTLDGLQTNGQFTNDIVGWAGQFSTLSWDNGKAKLLTDSPSASTRLETDDVYPPGTYHLRAKINPKYANATRFQIAGINGTSFSPTAAVEKQYSAIIIGTGTDKLRIYHDTSSNYIATDTVLFDDVQITKIDGTYLEGLTASQIDDMITYFESLQSVGSPVIYVPADYDQWIQDMYAAQGVVAGDTIQGFFIESIGKNKLPDVKDWEQGSFDSLDNLVAATNRIRSTRLVPILFGTTYVLSTIGDYIFSINELDSNGDLVNAYGLVSVDSTYTPSASNVTQLRISLRRLDSADLLPAELEIAEAMLEIKSTLPATEYEDFIKANAHINEEFGDVPNGATDDFDFVRTIPYVLTEDDIVTLDNRTNYQRITTRIFTEVKTSDSDTNNGNTRIANWSEYTFTQIETGSFNNFGYHQADQLFKFAVDLGTYASLAEAKSALVGTKVRLQLTTPLPRDGILAPLLDVTGNIITGPGYTYIQSSTSGITNEFKATTAVNTKSQINLNTDAIINLFKKDKNATDDIKKIQDDVSELEIKVAKTIEYTLIFDGDAPVDDAIVLPAANLTMDLPYTDFDGLRIVSNNGKDPNLGQFTYDILTDTLPSTTVLVDSIITETEKFDYTFKFTIRAGNQDVSVWFGRELALTEGVPPTFTNDPYADLAVVKIYGFNFPV